MKMILIVPKVILGTAVFILVVSFLFPKKTMDFHYGYTYAVISLSHILWALAFFLVLNWAIYRFCKEQLWSLSFFNFHSSLLLLCVFAFLIINVIKWKEIYLARLYFNEPIGLMLLLFILSQIMLVVNVVVGLFKASGNK